MLMMFDAADYAIDIFDFAGVSAIFLHAQASFFAHVPRREASTARSGGVRAARAVLLSVRV